MLTAILNAQKTTEYNVMKSGLTVITVSGRLFCLFSFFFCAPLSVTLFFFFHLLPTILSCTVSRGPGEPPGGQGEMERSGGPHSDSGSISPTWERDRRGPPPGPLPGPPGPLGPPGVCSYVREKKTGENQTVTSAHTANISQIIKTMFSKQKRRAKVSKNEVSVSMSNPC